MTKEPEKDFYQLNLDNYHVDLKNIQPSNKLDIDQRYGICKDSLKQNKSFKNNLIVELGSCRREECLIQLAKEFDFKNALGIDIFYKDNLTFENIKFLPHDLNKDWPLKSNSVDVLIAMMVLEHLFDPFFCFSEIKRVLKKDGVAFINLPLITNIKNRLRLLAGKLPTTSVPYKRWYKEKHWDGFHLHYFSIKSIHDLANQYGLKVTRIEAVGKMRWLKNLLPNIFCGEISFELRNK